ncbi:hypothetical protein GCM10011414_11460 [Croceivirga lutea]|uniref:Rossmann-like and DUF2520 domain-containing protein n=1 Tax=Croceivirga lutea TaxID=1775167 RepID=UPI00163A1B08|nr:DUF2520 domain-containing protein [Croceivirga lutea]GGG43507.1 hypothetical protein GCM10011414_11460 [Croceivirga lutea]
MHSIVLLGSGNVAHHLFAVLQPYIIQVYARNAENLKSFSQVKTTTKKNEIADADVYIIAVNDDAIEEVSTLLTSKSGLVVHTSGSVSINAIVTSRKGVFYPLQTFTKGKKLDFKNIPLCIEAQRIEDYELLEKIGGSISNLVRKISTKQRQTLHVAAVFVNNFSNHLFYLAEEICAQDAIEFNLLKPLIEETVAKIQDLSPKKAQTGPAKRNDEKTMHRHLQQLTAENNKKIYQLLSQSIQKTYEEKL